MTIGLYEYLIFAILVIFACHECIYMFYVWVHKASTIVLLETFSVTYTVLIQEMTREMKDLNLKDSLTSSRIEPIKKAKVLWVRHKDVDPFEVSGGKNTISLLSLKTTRKS